jgi:hypothetical protein
MNYSVSCSEAFDGKSTAQGSSQRRLPKLFQIGERFCGIFSLVDDSAYKHAVIEHAIEGDMVTDYKTVKLVVDFRSVATDVWELAQLRESSE